MKWATPTANITRRVVPREIRIGSDSAMLVTCMPGGYRGWCIRATWPADIGMGLAAWVAVLAVGLDHAYGWARIRVVPHAWPASRFSGSRSLPRRL